MRRNVTEPLKAFTEGVVCTCSEDYISRGVEDPSCEYHWWAYEIEAARALVADNKRLRHKVAYYIGEARRRMRQYDIMCDAMDDMERLLCRAAEAIENLVEAHMPTSDSELDWTIAKGEGVVADIRNALGGQDDN